MDVSKSQIQLFERRNRLRNLESNYEYKGDHPHNQNKSIWITRALHDENSPKSSPVRLITKGVQLDKHLVREQNETLANLKSSSHPNSNHQAG